MHPAWLQELSLWIAAHPAAAGLAVFAISFCEGVAVVGILVPALPLLFAVGVMVGLGEINGPYALACTALGALCGDSLSFWLGRRFGPQLRGLWLFRRYPEVLDRSERMFRKQGVKGIFIARFVGAVRPFVPAIAGMLGMPWRRYVPPAALAALAWAGAYLAPGWLFGASYEAIAAVAGRLLLVLLILLAVVSAIWAVVVYGSRAFARHADRGLARTLAWSHAHPRLGPHVARLLDPARPETPSLLLLLACIASVGWGLAAWIVALLMQGGPLPLDQHVYEAMFALRNPLADRLMAALASLADIQVLLPAFVVGLGWLAWRRRWPAVVHWIAAVAFGLLASELLKRIVHMPRPPTAPVGFGFPSVSVAMCAVVLGFFAVLIARELPGRRRMWPWLVAGTVTALVGFARLYLGAHWLSDVVMGVLFGVAWVLLLGVAYRRHVPRSFWMRPLALLFYGTLVAATLWHAPRRAGPLLERFSPPTPNVAITRAAWWQSDWRALSSGHHVGDGTTRWPLDLQVAGELAPLRARLQMSGWREQPQAGWLVALRALDERAKPQSQAVLPSALDGRPESLLMVRDDPSTGTRDVVRLWPAPARLDDGTPLWIGRVQRLVHVRRLWGLVGLWRPSRHPVRSQAAHAGVAAELQNLHALDAPVAAGEPPVLRIDLARPAGGG